MKQLWMFSAVLGLAGVGFAQAATQGPVVTARDDAAVARSAEDEGSEHGQFYMGAGVGAMRLHRESHPKPGSPLRGVSPYVILRMGWDFADSPLSLEGFASLGRSKTAKGTQKQSLLGVGVEALLHADRYSAFDPFLAVGASYYGSNVAPTWQDGQRSHLFAQVGVGAFWHFSENLSLRGDLRYHVGLTDDFVSFSTADIGLTYFIGGGETSSADTVQPLAETDAIEPGARRYDEASTLSDKLVDVTPVGTPDVMKLELRVQYAKDTAQIEPTEYAALDELVRIIKAALAANPEVFVSIDGHADRQYGSDHAYNQELSEARAKSVKTYLSLNGIPDGKMKAAGHSFDQPKDPVNLKDGTPSNRRTEVAIRGVDAATREKIRASLK